MVMVFILCSVPYATLVIYQTVLNVPDTSVSCCSRPFGCPKSLLANPVLFLTVNKSVRKCLVGDLVQLHHRYSRRNVVGTGSGMADASLSPACAQAANSWRCSTLGSSRSSSPRRMRKRAEVKYPGSGALQAKELLPTLPEWSWGHSSAPAPPRAWTLPQVAPAVPNLRHFPQYSLQFGFGPLSCLPVALRDPKQQEEVASSLW